MDEALKSRPDLSVLRPVVEKGLPASVSKPLKTTGKVSTWKLTIETRPGQKHLPAQRIHLDIRAIPSHDPRPMMLRNIHGVDLGTSGLILQAQSREEILADKIIALAFREWPDHHPGHGRKKLRGNSHAGGLTGRGRIALLAP